MKSNLQKCIVYRGQTCGKSDYAQKHGAPDPREAYVFNGRFLFGFPLGEGSHSLEHRLTQIYEDEEGSIVLYDRQRKPQTHNVTIYRYWLFSNFDELKKNWPLEEKYLWIADRAEEEMAAMK